MSAAYIRRLADSTAASTALCLRQTLRQQWFLLILIPFGLVLILAPLLPVASETAAFRLLVKIALGAGSVVLSLGIILTGSNTLPSEIRDKTIQRSIGSPGGRLPALTGRITAFSLLAAFCAFLGLAGTFLAFTIRAGSSTEFAAASRQYISTAAEKHSYRIVNRPSNTRGILWVTEKAPEITWTFLCDSPAPDGKLTFQITPVVASSVKTKAKITFDKNCRKCSDSRTVMLSDNLPLNIEFAEILEHGQCHEITVKRLPGSSPFGFHIGKTELGNEKNGVSLLTGTRPFGANLLAAWLIVWAKLTFVGSVAIFASTFLSAPVAGALSLLLYLLASILGFLSEFAQSIGKIGTHCHAHIHHAHQGPQELTFFQNIIKTLITWFAKLFPDLSRFDAANALVWGRAIPLGFVLSALLYFLPYCILLWFASALILQRREF